MSLDKTELKYLITELKKVFATKKEFNNIRDIVDEPPVYTKPTVSLGVKPANIFHNMTFDVLLTPQFVQNDAGEITKIVIKRNGETIVEASSIDQFSDLVIGSHGDRFYYELELYYGEGVIKNTELGRPDNVNNIKEGMIIATNNVRVYAPSFYGIMDDNNNFIEAEKILNTSKNRTFEDITMKNSRFAYVYPSSFGEITSIKDANNFEYINSYTKNVMEVEGVEYFAYVLTDPVTITGFKQIFS